LIHIKGLSVKNFMSVGNATQGVNFDRQDLTLVLGENLDLGGDGNRNGTGKTTIINALSYALYGSALSNIKKDNLVNKTNGKHMLVSLEFSVAGQDYKIERGRKPNVLRFFVNNQEQQLEDAAQGDSRETQDFIAKTLGMSHDMFKHIVALNTYTEPFLSLRANDQRIIIEQLLGITQLSERAEKIKELTKQTKDLITQEEFRIRATVDANQRIEESIESLKKRQRLWNTKKDEDISKLVESLDSLSHLDVDTELLSHKSQSEWDELSKHKTQLENWITEIESREKKYQKIAEKLTTEIAHLEDHKCYACGQDFHDEKHEKVLNDKKKLLQDNALESLSTNSEWIEHTKTLETLGDIGPRPVTFYSTFEDALNHRNSVTTLTERLEERMKEMNPYDEQIDEMREQAIQEIKYDTLNDLTRLQEHQDFLLKLLTNKDSFIRKKIIEQNLSYLNTRLTHYLDRMGLPHSVVFQTDLSVNIEELGRELDFDNLSRGERNRLILSMSWAFRDVFESLYQPINLLFIDELIDSGLDTQGVDNALSLLKQISRERSKSIWLVSHRDELTGRVENILKVIKENGYTNYTE
jgi:DNA repair exonuclease SbcCD ATPase subunit